MQTADGVLALPGGYSTAVHPTGMNVPCTTEPHLSVHMGPTPDRQITSSKMLPFSITILQISGAPKSIGITSSQLQDRVGRGPTRYSRVLEILEK